MKYFLALIFGTLLFQCTAQEIIQTHQDINELKKKWNAACNNERQFTILHIGDSHLQPNNLSGITRFQFQKKAGNAGRGLIFPYTLAKTNGPKDFTFSSNTPWENAWIIKPPSFDIGLTGISIKSIPTSGGFKWKTGKDTLNYPADRGWISFIMNDCHDCSVEINGRVKKYDHSMQDTIQFKITADTNELKFKNGRLTLLDLAELSSQPGVVYHSTGVAGATFQTYEQNPWFKSELKYFPSDLIIVSLGTNESFKKWNENELTQSINSFIKILKTEQPLASILIVLPNENYKQHNKEWEYNERLENVRTVLKNIALKEDLIVYDQQYAMGGKGCMLDWEKQQLVNKDHIHFLKKGYQKQGLLLYQYLNAFLSIK
jgi:lysophospholipase L1-like esterase